MVLAFTLDQFLKLAPAPIKVMVKHFAEVYVGLALLLEGPCLVTTSILFCWLFTIKDKCNKSAFLTNAQSRFTSVDFDVVL